MPFFAWITLPSVISHCHVQNLPVILCSHSLTDLLTDWYQAYCLIGQFFKKKKMEWQIPSDLSMLRSFSFVLTSYMSIPFQNFPLHSLCNLSLYTQLLHFYWKLKQHIQFILGVISQVLSCLFCTKIIIVICLFLLNKGPFALCFKKKNIKSVWLSLTFDNFLSSWLRKCSLIHVYLDSF